MQVRCLVVVSKLTSTKPERELEATVVTNCILSDRASPREDVECFSRLMTCNELSVEGVKETPKKVLWYMGRMFMPICMESCRAIAQDPQLHSEAYDKNRVPHHAPYAMPHEGVLLQSRDKNPTFYGLGIYELQDQESKKQAAMYIYPHAKQRHVPCDAYSVEEQTFAELFGCI
ncbi:hypothetical protein EDD15DRAFT_2191440 [Pisolithus albus]|nr:hypothetical protein EDD15DRAFT_2191440 [Pisolithus albus]